jgi:hypothetical protein
MVDYPAAAPGLVRRPQSTQRLELQTSGLRLNSLMISVIAATLATRHRAALAVPPPLLPHQRQAQPPLM